MIQFMKTVTLMIKPQTHVRSTQGDAIFFRIPEDKLQPSGLKRKKRLMRYNKYKTDLFDIAQENNFEIPDGYFHVIFYLPIPKYYPKKVRPQMHLRPHLKTPDIDNFFKGFLDSLKKRDQTVHDARIQKVWVDQEQGYIQIEY